MSVGGLDMGVEKRTKETEKQLFRAYFSDSNTP